MVFLYENKTVNLILLFITIPDQKIICFVDENLVARIFSNIISNSIKYSDGDLKILLTEKGEIIFSNHASGLTEIQTGRLFDRFYTVNSARKSTGLGLSIAKILTEKMGGTITANYQNNVISIHVWFES
ncbi:HAMP domain-containing sensor histidine kinase [Muricomes intestini]|uniref:sensor histidine kinase n=1 Tax=Muricomes intestini TaxID=1796634 RepID=UPI002FE0BF44